MAKTSQKQNILQYLKTNGSITPRDAIDKFNCYRLAARIGELRCDGYEIITDNKNESGMEVNYAIYRLAGEAASC